MADGGPPYKVGISTGFYRIGKDPNLLGLAQKIAGLGATGGIQFVQIDLETIAEFYEPELKVQINRMRERLNMYAGLHGEIGQLAALDSAEKNIWEQTHLRLCQTVKFAADLKFFYVNIHFSNRQILALTEQQQRGQGALYPVVDPYGKGLQYIVQGNVHLYPEVMRHMSGYVQRSDTYQEERRKLQEQKLATLDQRVETEFQRQIKLNPGASEEEKKNLRRGIREQLQQAILEEVYSIERRPEFQFETWLKLKREEHERYILEDGEFGAYHIVARWMKDKNDYLWNTIAGGKDPKILYFSEELADQLAFHAAVASKYIEAHLTLKDHAANRTVLQGMSIKEWCEKHQLYLLLENPESGEGAEGLFRLFHPQHFYHTIKSLNSPYIKVTIDFEHMVSQAIDPDELLPKLPGDFGKQILLFHLGQAVPYGGTSHIPIAQGSLAQEQIYRWLYILRKKGWKSGFIMFERGAGRTGAGRSPYEVFEDSVQALRQIVKYLPLDVDPAKLPLEFYGISSDNKDAWARQIVAMRDHAWDPLDGVLAVPEEKHTFLSGAAIQRQKGQEWERRKYR